MAAESCASGARQRYSKAFSSSIFDPAGVRQERAAPAGKRRDQTTSEMFGSYDEKDLRGMPKTFMPKDDLHTAREKKLNHLSSGVLPTSDRRQTVATTSPCFTGPRFQGRLGPDEEEDDDVDANLRRQADLSSKLFGRQTPAVTADQVHDPERKLTPNDFTWSNHPQAATCVDTEINAAERAFHQKCSKVFDHISPNTMGHHKEITKQAKEEALAGEQSRRANPRYSDLFGRSAYEPQGEAAEWRPRSRRSAEDKISVHQDWTDSRTELLNGPNGAKEGTPAMRKSQELHGSQRIFGQEGGHRSGSQNLAQQPDKSTRLQSLEFDNSMKLKNAIGLTPQQIHQAHQRSSVVSDETYEEAQSSKDWQVAELFLSGLPRHGDEKMVRNMCQGFDLQLVRVTIDEDPVRNLCKGRAKIMVRYNPKKDPIEALARQFQLSGLQVEM